MTVTADQSLQLQQAEAAYRAAVARVEATERVARDAAIRAALTGGMTQREVAAATGLSAGRIAQIALGKR